LPAALRQHPPPCAGRSGWQRHLRIPFYACKARLCLEHGLALLAAGEAAVARRLLVLADLLLVVGLERLPAPELHEVSRLAARHLPRRTRRQPFSPRAIQPPLLPRAYASGRRLRPGPRGRGGTLKRRMALSIGSPSLTCTLMSTIERAGAAACSPHRRRSLLRTVQRRRRRRRRRRCRCGHDQGHGPLRPKGLPRSSSRNRGPGRPRLHASGKAVV
jgi:hypothetical protein